MGLGAAVANSGRSVDSANKIEENKKLNGFEGQSRCGGVYIHAPISQAIQMHSYNADQHAADK